MIQLTKPLVLLSLLALPMVSAAQNPVLTVTEPELGSWVFEGVTDPVVELQIASGEPLDFNWLGDASGYGGAITGYRYGWDVVDPDDPDDPGWATGFLPGLLAAPTQTLAAGVHSLHIEVQDNAGGLTRAGFLLTVHVVPTPGRSWGAMKRGYGY